MFILKNEIQFDMAHYLRDYEGKCASIHGHRYRLIAKVSSEELHAHGQFRGMVDDFSNVKKVLKVVKDFFDHKFLLEDHEDSRKMAEQLVAMNHAFDIVFVPYRTTAEEMARHIYGMLKEKGLNVCEVELFETPTNSCIYME
jgi:6-pyruvoyltetrahydropterin/6-carboxytetrahydropterin synthase